MVITDQKGQPLDTTTGASWVGYANAGLRRRIEPHVLEYLERIEDRA